VIIEWTRPALSDLIGIRRYIAADAPSAAEEVARGVTQAVERLMLFPASGRPGRKPRTRELVVSTMPYLVVYDVRADTVRILRVLHTARQPR
jgi:toxin ParE1/3/4